MLACTICMFCTAIIISCAVFFYRAHVEGIAFKTNDIQAFGLQSSDDPRKRLVTPRIGKSRKIRIDLYDDIAYPHLETQLPERMLYGRHEFDKFHFIS